MILFIFEGSRGGLGLKLNKGQVGQSFQVFNDENQDPSQLPSQKGQWSQTPKTAVLNKENDQKPGVWTKAKVCLWFILCFHSW